MAQNFSEATVSYCEYLTSGVSEARDLIGNWMNLWQKAEPTKGNAKKSDKEPPKSPGGWF